jgi:hypothetical protein
MLVDLTREAGKESEESDFSYVAKMDRGLRHRYVQDWAQFGNIPLPHVLGDDAFVRTDQVAINRRRLCCHSFEPSRGSVATDLQEIVISWRVRN